MNNIKTGKERRKVKSKGRNKGSSTAPRLSVFRSNRQIYIQAIDDIKGVTIESSSSAELTKNTKGKKMNKSEQAKLVGETLGEKLKNKKINKAVFDRSGYKYHGRVKNIAEGVRESGINF